MHILVTGATGFIGRSVVRAALDRGHRVTALVRDLPKANALLPSHSGLHLSPCPDISHFEPDTQGYDRLIHLAWDGRMKYTDPASLTENLIPQFSFLNRLAASGLHDMTLAGTCLEYGMREGALCESDMPQPTTYYGLAKWTLYNMLLILRDKTPGLCLKELRYFYAYGPHQRAQSLFPQLLAAIARDDKTFDMSQGDQERDFIHIDTLAQNTVAIAEHHEHMGVLNVGNGRNIRVVDFAREILRAKNHQMQLNLGFYPRPAYEPFSFYADVTKLKTVPGIQFDSAVTV